MKKFVLLMILTLGMGCANKQAPEITVVQYTGTVLAAANELQKGITAATDQKVISVALGQQLTGYVDQVYQRSGPLLASLKLYHAAASLDLKKLEAAKIQGMISAINTALGQLLGTSIPEGALKQISLLVGNVMAAVGAVQAEIAKGLGVASNNFVHFAWAA